MVCWLFRLSQNGKTRKALSIVLQHSRWRYAVGGLCRCNCVVFCVLHCIMYETTVVLCWKCATRLDRATLGLGYSYDISQAEWSNLVGSSRANLFRWK